MSPAVDFEAGKVVEQNQEERMFEILGTAGYIAPE